MLLCSVQMITCEASHDTDYANCHGKLDCLASTMYLCKMLLEVSNVLGVKAGQQVVVQAVQLSLDVL